MFTRILVPTDFSRSSGAALAHARRLAAPTGATLHVLHVADNVFLRTVLADPRNYEATALWQLREQFPGGDAGATLVVERSEAPADEIARYARIHNIDLIVMGTHGRGCMANLLLGSVAEKVVRTAPCPVLTVREAPVGSEPKDLRILVATDFSASSDAALGYAKRLAARDDPSPARRRAVCQRCVPRFRTGHRGAGARGADSDSAASPLASNARRQAQGAHPAEEPAEAVAMGVAV